MSRSDADWEMFCRGRSVAGAGSEPVELEPAADEAALAGDPPGAKVRHFHTRIVGVVYPNQDGTSRREAVRTLRRLDRVRLAHRPDNPVDPNAVAVMRHPDGPQLGYLPAVIAKDLVPAACEHGTRYVALVTDVTGASADDFLSVEPVGANLVILVLEQSATRAMARRYLLGLMNRG
jgi:hypothetical protein